jgi:hypothetical protein
MLEETRRDVPRLGAASELRAGRDSDADAEQHRAHPVASRPGRTPAGEPIGLPEQCEDAHREDEQKHRQLASHQRSDDTERRCDPQRAQARPRNRRRNGPQCRGRDRIGKRLVKQVRRVCQRRRGDCHGRRRQRPRTRDDETRERVGGEDRSGHREHADQLRHLPRLLRIVEPPGGGDEIGVERLEAARLAEAGRDAVLGDATRDLCELDLVREDGRRNAARCLPGVERRE